MAENAQQPPKPNIGEDLVRIHMIITRGLKVATDKSKFFYEEGYPDDKTRDGFVAYVKTAAHVIEGHHLTEDEMAFPAFREMKPDAPYDRLMAEHKKMQAILEEIKSEIKKIEDDPEDKEPLKALNNAFTRLSEIWHPHIKIEEKHLSSESAAEMLSVEENIEWGKKLAKHSQDHAGPDFLAVPFHLYNLPKDQRAIMAGQMPPIVTEELVPVVWKEKWTPMKPFLLP